MDELFQQAARQKVRFVYRGVITAEDLWDLSESALDTIYGNLKAQQRETSESLLATKTADSELLELQIALVKHVFETKQQEALDRKAAAEKKARKQKLLDALAQKQDAKLQDLSEEDLRKMIEEL